MIADDHFAMRENMPSHRIFNFSPGSPRRQVQPRIQRVQRKHVAVRRFSWRTRPSIARLVEIVLALPRTVRQLLQFWQSLRQLPLPRRHVVKHPMDKRPKRRVAVDDDQRQTLRPRRRRSPGQSRRNFCIIAGKLLRYFASLKARTRQVQRRLPLGDSHRPTTTRRRSQNETQPNRHTDRHLPPTTLRWVRVSHKPIFAETE